MTIEFFGMEIACRYKRVKTNRAPKTPLLHYQKVICIHNIRTVIVIQYILESPLLKFQGLD